MFKRDQIEYALDHEKVKASAEEGFQCGMEWRIEWINSTPGGPWVYTGANGQKAAQSDAENKAWREAWHQGIKENPNRHLRTHSK